ncbi:MAG: HD domain-containing protein [Candidatus Margulisiibacteriota bacterium]
MRIPKTGKQLNIPFPPGPSPAGRSAALVLCREIRFSATPNWFKYLTANLLGRDFSVMNRALVLCRRELQGLMSGSSEPERRLLEDAFLLAWRAHNGQFRKSGEPYIVHVMETARIVKRWGLGAEEVAAALLHDVIEDGYLSGNNITKEELGNLITEGVAKLVDGITELGKEPDYVGKKPSKEYIMRKLLDAASLDLAVLIIKFADRLHNMRTLAYTHSASAKKKAAETLYVYSRIADILGIWTLKRNFEDLAYKYLEPENFYAIREYRDAIVRESEPRVKEIMADIERALAEHGIAGIVRLEIRGVFELYQRFELRGKKMTDIAADDIWRVVVIVPSEKNYGCYLAMGIIHGVYHPAQNQKIEDHLNEARPNGHRFLHTYVQVPGGQLLIQIRDTVMYREYHGGVLASVSKDRDWHGLNRRWLEALRKHLESEYRLSDDDIYRIIAAESVPITVYTPNRGRPLPFPQGATALDFAFHLRPEGALHAVSAEINGCRGESLFTPLKDGDRVYIKIDPKAAPELNWLEHVRTPEAAQAIRNFLADLPENEMMGNALFYLRGKLREYYLPVKAFMVSKYFGAFLRENGYDSWSDFLKRIGLGEMRDLSSLLAAFMDEYSALIKTGSSRKNPIGFEIVGQDEPGFIGKITGQLAKCGMNIAYSYSRTEVINGREMGVVTLVVKGVGGDAGEIQKMQIAATLHFTEGIINFIELSPEEIGRLEKTLKGG